MATLPRPLSILLRKPPRARTLVFSPSPTSGALADPILDVSGGPALARKASREPTIPTLRRIQTPGACLPSLLTDPEKNKAFCQDLPRRETSTTQSAAAFPSLRVPASHLRPIHVRGASPLRRVHGFSADRNHRRVLSPIREPSPPAWFLQIYIQSRVFIVLVAGTLSSFVDGFANFSAMWASSVAPGLTRGKEMASLDLQSEEKTHTPLAPAHCDVNGRDSTAKHTTAHPAVS